MGDASSQLNELSFQWLLIPHNNIAYYMTDESVALTVQREILAVLAVNIQAVLECWSAL